MSTFVALRDRRLEGGVPARPRLVIINTDATTPLGVAFRQIMSAAPSRGGVHSLFILCHGYAGSNPTVGSCVDADGMGLQLGREDVLHSNVHRWTAIRGKVQNIVVYSCAASNTESGNEGTTADGRYLMGALAIHTQANVYAADRIQWYSKYKNRPDGRFDFGEWEGTLYHFSPSAAPPRVVSGPPVEFTDVMISSIA